MVSSLLGPEIWTNLCKHRKSPSKIHQKSGEIDVESNLIHLLYQKSNYFISTNGKRARRVHQTPKISKNFTQENLKDTWNIWAKNQNLDENQNSESKFWLENSEFRCMKFYHELTRKSCLNLWIYDWLSVKTNIIVQTLHNHPYSSIIPKWHVAYLQKILVC